MRPSVGDMSLREGPAAALPSVPIDIVLCVLDQLVATRDNHRPIAYAPSNSITKALRALTLTSRRIYPTASRYLYAYCLYLGDYTSFSCFRRTLGLPLGHNHPVCLDHGQAGRNDNLFIQARITQYVASLFISPASTRGTPLLRPPEILDLCNVVGPTLKRLVLDLHPVYSVASELLLMDSQNPIFASMTVLEELVVSYEIMDFLPAIPLKLRHLAVTTQGTEDAVLDWALSIPRLETFMVLRKPEMARKDIEKVFSRCPARRTQPLDVVLVDVNANHCTPRRTRDWTDSDVIRFWEIDVPTSYYGDETDLVVCDGWIWEQAVAGTLFGSEKRRMPSWSEVSARIAALRL